MSIPDDQARIAFALVRYLRLHPQASDTAEGIARWWLRGEIDMDVRRVQQALDWMNEAGLIESIHAGDGRKRYRRSSDTVEFERRVARVLRLRPTDGSVH